MALPRQWSVPVGTTEIVNGSVALSTATPTGPGFNLAADSIQVPTLVTAPPNSASVFAPASYTNTAASIATVVQNTLGYDAQFTGFFAVGAGGASVAAFQLGVGAASVVPMTTVVPSVTAASGNVWSFPAYVPTGYYYSFQASQANGASVNGQLTIQATPV